LKLRTQLLSSINKTFPKFPLLHLSQFSELQIEITIYLSWETEECEFSFN